MEYNVGKDFKAEELYKEVDLGEGRKKSKAWKYIAGVAGGLAGLALLWNVFGSGVGSKPEYKGVKEKPAVTESVTKKSPKPGFKPYLGGLAWIDDEGWIYPDEVNESYPNTKEGAVLEYVEKLNEEYIKKWGLPCTACIKKFKLYEEDARKYYPEFIVEPGEKVMVMEFFRLISKHSHKWLPSFERDENGKIYMDGYN